MLRIIVGKNDADYATVQEAIDAVPYEDSAEIQVEPGIYREKLFCEKKDITIVGAGIDETVIDCDDYANEIMPDGSKRGTFRSFTAFFGGKRVCVKDLTIRNSAGDGRVVGQAVAVYADADVCRFENVKMTGCQDTLFCAPLPVSERQKNGFMGPRMMTERRLTKQYYKNCLITGDVDFIFGGADAVFDDCEIICNDRMFGRSSGAGAGNVGGSSAVDKDQIDISERIINGYITAACGLKDNLGFVFRNCRIFGAKGCERGSVFLGRPWREEARTVFLNCTMDETIAPERFSGWGGIDKDEPSTFYGEFGTKLVAGAENADSDAILVPVNKNPWVKDIDSSLATEISRRADEVVAICC
jgi:pectinesterase